MSSSVAERRLQEFLSLRSVKINDLLAEVERVFGQPELVVATGSVLAGFGNSTSDIDLIVVVPRSGLSDLPILSFANGLRIDVEYYDAADMQRQVELLRQESWPPRNAIDRSLWRKFSRMFRLLTRLESSYVLLGTPEWRVTLDSLRQGWLQAALVDWWQTEAIRCELSARWVLPTNPLLASLRIGDALFAALNARAADRGELYFHRRWLGEKLKKLGDASLLSSYERALCSPLLDSEDAARYHETWVDYKNVLAPLRSRSGYMYVLLLENGVKALRTPEGILISHWGLSGLLCQSSELCAFDPGKSIVATGSLDDEPEPLTIELFRHGMCWLGVAGQQGGLDGAPND